MKAKQKRKPQRRGTVCWIQFPTNLKAALDHESSLDRDGADFARTIRRICRQWLEGKTSDHPTIIPPEPAIRIGRPKKIDIQKRGIGKPKKASLSQPTDTGADAQAAQETTGAAISSR